MIFQVVAFDDKGEGLGVKGEKNWAEDRPLWHTIVDMNRLGG